MRSAREIERDMALAAWEVAGCILARARLEEIRGYRTPEEEARIAELRAKEEAASRKLSRLREEHSLLLSSMRRKA